MHFCFWHEIQRRSDLHFIEPYSFDYSLATCCVSDKRFSQEDPNNRFFVFCLAQWNSTVTNVLDSGQKLFVQNTVKRQCSDVRISSHDVFTPQILDLKRAFYHVRLNFVKTLYILWQVFSIHLRQSLFCVQQN